MILKKLLKIKPDLLVVLGDRYEIFSASTSALVHQIPICHLHGGELESQLKDYQVLQRGYLFSIVPIVSQ